MTVYFIQAEDGGPIKIGKSRNLPLRLYQLQHQTGKRLKILGVVQGDIDKEKELHDQFADLRLHGEWFNPSAELITYIELHAQDIDIKSKFTPRSYQSEIPLSSKREPSSQPSIEVKLIDLWHRKEAKKGRFITVREIAEQTGLDRDTVNRFVNNELKRFDSDVITALCKFFDVPEGGPIPFLVFRAARSDQ